MNKPTALNILKIGVSDDLAPLREVGTMEKTQFWDIDEVMVALRIANLRGVPLRALRRTGSADPMALRASA